MTLFEPVLHCFSPKNDDELKNKDNPKKEDNPKSNDDPKNEDKPKNKDNPKIVEGPINEDDPKNTAKQSRSRTVCASSMYSCLCMKLSSFLFAHAGNAVYIIFIMWDSISGLDTWYDFWFNISCGVVVKVRSHQEKI